MGFLSHWPLIMILVVVLIIFGPGKLPQIGGAIGTAINEFRKATTEVRDDLSRSAELVPEARVTGTSVSQPVAATAVQPESEPKNEAAAPLKA